jgi:DNA-binding transcriptional LysR family regulator
MRNLRREINSINALVTFEAAARLRSFTLASRELGVTQAAVSRQIKNLEADLGLQLFQRQNRKVEPTMNGAFLCTSLSRSFDHIAETIRLLRRNAQTEELTVGATVALSHFWLLPRIAGFRAAHPALNLRIISQDALPELATDNIDVIIRYSEEPIAGTKSLLLASDEVFPVCSPGYAQRAGPFATIDDLTGGALITYETNETGWLGWNEWFERSGSTFRVNRTSLHLNHYTDALSAAMNGQGIALGWGRMVADALADGRLIRITDAIVRPQGGYYISTHANRAEKAAVTAFVDWIKSQS